MQKLASRLFVLSPFRNVLVGCCKRRGGLLFCLNHFSSHCDVANVQRFLSNLAPLLDGKSHKGQAGRVGVLGGSEVFVGAPYYAGMAALRTGSDLLYCFTAEEASIPLKCFSPELMVFSVYSASWPEGRDIGVSKMVSKIAAVLPRLTALVIGPGLGTDPSVLKAASEVIALARMQNLPLIIDADALRLVMENSQLVEGNTNVVLTPNAREFRLLSEKLRKKEELLLDISAVIDIGQTLKGAEDLISDGSNSIICQAVGSPRRSGGQGDLLAGVLGTLMSWIHIRQTTQIKPLPASREEEGIKSDLNEISLLKLEAINVGCWLVKTAAALAFEECGRATTAPDVLRHLGPVMNRYSM